MDSSIDFIIDVDRPQLGHLKKAKFRSIFNAILNELPHMSAKVELLLVTSARMRGLNKKHRKKDKPTDVLSFPFEAGDLLGSIVIDLETAKRQAKEFRQSFEKETYELFIHGVLHLLGMDHESHAQADLMRCYENYFSNKLL